MQSNKAPHWTKALPEITPSWAIEWCRTQKTLSEAWKNCVEPSLMFGLLALTKENHKKFILASCGCVRLALRYTKDPRAMTCIETTEAWAKGRATIKQVHEARKEACSASAEAYAAALAASSKVSFAAYCSGSPSYAFGQTAYIASDSAAADAWDGHGSIDASKDARKEMLAKCCDVIREHFPEPSQLKDL